MISDDEGARLIQDLQALTGVDEPMEKALSGWRAFTKREKENTIAAHEFLVGGKKW